jgi:hypothetical protein
MKNKTTKSKTFTLKKSEHRTYTFSNDYFGICEDFVIAHIGKAPSKIAVRVRLTMASGYTKARWPYRDGLVWIGRDVYSLFSYVGRVLNSAVGQSKTFYFKITEAK